MSEAAPQFDDDCYGIDDLIIDVRRQRVLRGDTEIPLSPLSFELLLALLRAAPDLVSLNKLMKQVWPDAVVSAETVSQRIKLVRDALGDHADSPRYIAGVRGRGYRIVPPVGPLTAPPKPQPDQRRIDRRTRVFLYAGFALLLLTIIAVTTAGVRLWIQQSRMDWARMVALPEATGLLEKGQTYAAFRLLQRAEAHVPDDPILEQLLVESTTPVTIRSTPPGAAIYTRDYFDESGTWDFLGVTPIDSVRLPTGMLVSKIELEGYQTREVLAYTPARILEFPLQPVAEALPDMVQVPGGLIEFFTQTALLEDFWIDQYEVTNRQYKTFLDQGGYERAEYWTEPFVQEGTELAWEDARELFRDRTGRPGPATWEVGTYPDGLDDFPVGGLSWYEAAAYCNSVGKQLPTLYHWYHAADWAAMTGFIQFSNFNSDGPARVGHPLRLGVHGTYDMAGNVKEWGFNEARAGRRYVLGGGWSEPSYLFRDVDAQQPWVREPMYGIRCARYGSPLPAAQTAPVPTPFRDYRQETPASDEMFALYRSLYEYDRTPLIPRLHPVREEFEHWSVERVSFAAAYGNERVPAQLFLPKSARPPFQTVVYFPPGSHFYLRASGPATTGNLEELWFLFLVRSGRAVLLPAYKGTSARYVGPMNLPHIWRDVMIHSAKDLRRAVDYLETRPDIDARKLAYFGFSLGAAIGPIMTAVEPRFRASILLGGGLFFWERPPESEAFHFLPRVRVPTLMINGRHDFFIDFETSQVPMFEHLGTAPEDKRHLVFESGHIPAERNMMIKEALDWLDHYLGPVE